MFRRPAHRRVAALLDALDAALLGGFGCLFGGGTRIALELDEYRESRDVAFLTSDGAGFAALRMLVRDRGCLALFVPGAPVSLQREAKVDPYAVRFPVGIDGASLRVELIREARIPLDPAASVPLLGVPCLGTSDCFAEKLLANSDRWPDDSVLSRDLIDLAALSLRHGPIPPAAWKKAEEAYAAAVRSDLRKASARWVGSSAVRERSLAGLAIGEELRAPMAACIARWAGE